MAHPAVAASDPLRFPADQFVLDSVSVKTAAGERKVVYRSYQHLLYVTKPVDKNYESLDVKVPISIDGKPVDASNAPILFIVGVGGYMSSPNIRDTSTIMMGGPGGPGAPGGPPPGLGGPGGPGGPPGGPGPSGGFENMGLAEGWVIVHPGVRGRDNRDKEGNYYGKAPAAIVDLKAAVRYIRHNRGVLPGNNEQIVSTGCSAGGALSSLLAASGNSPLYEPYLKEIGAAEAADNIFAAGCHSPVTDLDHADMTYEFEFGASKTIGSRTVDQAISAELQEKYRSYQASLNLKGRNNFGTLTADNFGEYMVSNYLAPSAEHYLSGLSDDKRKEYLAGNPWLSWDGKRAAFKLADFASQHIKRFKGAPAFDDFSMTSPETNLFGNSSSNAAHFTNFSLRHATGDPTATIDPQLQNVVNMMNPMYFILQHNPGVALHWWIRHGATETDSSGVGAVNLATGLEDMGHDVNTVLYWDAGHCEDLDPQGFVTWVSKVTGYRPAN
jgi:acetyl esterase/lipase